MAANNPTSMVPRLSLPGSLIPFSGNRRRALFFAGLVSRALRAGVPEDFLGDSIFNTDHEKWSKSRQLLRPMFARERVGDLIVFENHLQKLLPMCGPGDGRAVDISALFYRYTLDAATDFILGRAMGNLDEENNEFAAVFGEVQRVQSIITRAGSVLH